MDQRLVTLSSLPPDVVRFIERCIHSVEQMEVLLLLHGSSGKSWTAETVAAETGISRAVAENCLENLATHNLLDVRLAETVVYRFSPGTAALESAVRAMAIAYREQPVGVLTVVLRRPSGAVRHFADAFRLRREEDA